MKNRVLAKIQQAQVNHKKLFCAFLTLGFPDLKTTEHLIKEFEKIGVDFVELGFPFSDPLADGPTIQFSSERALEKGTRLRDAFELVRRLRRQGIQIPILFFGYLNPIYHHGIQRFVTEAKQSGFDGLIIPDLPPEEESELAAECRRQNLVQVYLVAPTTEKKRAALIARQSQGFIYYVSLRGVTGARRALPRDLKNRLKTFRQLTHKPLLVGFGVSTPGQAKEMARFSDGVIVGSALIEKLRQARGKTTKVIPFVREMIQAVKG